MAIKNVLLSIGALGIVVVITSLVVMRMVRPAPPDLNDPSTWMLIKADHTKDSALRVYVTERRSTTWDPYDVAQNKIVVKSGSALQEFRWPYNYEYAAGWCELFRGIDGSVAIVLFGSETVVRVVTFADGGFVFRRGKDELLADHELTYERPTDGDELTFVVREVNGAPPSDQTNVLQAWQWTRTTGFRELPTSVQTNVSGMK